MRYRLNRIALEELISAAQYYESCQIGLGRRFLDQVYKSINTILDAPNRWPELEPGRRRYRLDDFPYGLIYRVENEQMVEIDVVMHLHREPSYWHGR
jgi:plasmid stabilization system protein ParE